MGLYPHNQAAHRTALSILSETGKTAVIHPTGTGKSFIGFKSAGERTKKLNVLRMNWLTVAERTWYRYYDMAARYKRKYGHLDVPVAYRESGRKLGQWVESQKQRYEDGKLTAEQILRLRELGTAWAAEKRTVDFAAVHTCAGVRV